MADITMCSGRGCAQHDACRRYRSKPDEFAQSWFAEVPVKPDGSCEHLILFYPPPASVTPIVESLFIKSKNPKGVA